MDSDRIFEYSDGFLLEILEYLVNLRSYNSTKIASNEFTSQLRGLLGKSIENKGLENIEKLKDEELKLKINTIFLELRNDRIKSVNEQNAKNIEKGIFLQCIDSNWKSHIQYLEHLRQVIGLRSYGSRDPLIEYKKEAFTLFENLLDKLKKDFLTILLNISLENQESNQTSVDPKPIGKKMKRNESCFCGSGKKFKHCCGTL